MFDIVAMICVAFAGAYTQPTYRYDDSDDDN